MENRIRVLALAILRREDGRLLLEKGHDTVKNETFYRPMGGGIEFGETGAQALAREFREELGREIIIDEAMATVENIFEFQGQPGHQVILFYRCRFKDAADYDTKYIQRIDGVAGHTYWKSVEDMAAEGALLHPWQIRELLG